MRLAWNKALGQGRLNLTADVFNVFNSGTVLRRVDAADRRVQPHRPDPEPAARALRRAVELLEGGGTLAVSPLPPATLARVNRARSAARCSRAEQSSGSRARPPGVEPPGGRARLFLSDDSFDRAVRRVARTLVGLARARRGLRRRAIQRPAGGSLEGHAGRARLDRHPARRPPAGLRLHGGRDAGDRRAAARRDLFENAYSHCAAHASRRTPRCSPACCRPSTACATTSATSSTPKHETLACACSQARGYATGAAVSAYVLRRATGHRPGLRLLRRGGRRPPARRPSARCSAPGRQTVARALDWLRGTGGRPFFLFLHLYEPHTPWTPPPEQLARYGATLRGRDRRGRRGVGQLLDGLRQLGRYDEALVVLVSDHGEGLGDHGEAEHGILLYREALHVPLLVKLPGAERGGSRAAGARGPARRRAHDRGRCSASRRPPAAHGRNLLDAAGAADGLGLQRDLLPADPPRLERAALARRRPLPPDRRPAAGALRRRARSGRAERRPRPRSPRTAAAMRSALASGIADFKPPAPATKEERERADEPRLPGAEAPRRRSRRSSLPNPRDKIASYARARAAFALVAQGKDKEAVAAFDAVLAREPALRGRADGARRGARAARPLSRFRASLRNGHREGAGPGGPAVAHARARRARDGRLREGLGFGAQGRSRRSRPWRTSCSRRSRSPRASSTRPSARPRWSPATRAPRRARPSCWPR